MQSQAFSTERFRSEKRALNTSQCFQSRNRSTASGDCSPSWALISPTWQGAPPPLFLVHTGLKIPAELVGKCPVLAPVAASLGKEAGTR